MKWSCSLVMIMFVLHWASIFIGVSRENPIRDRLFPYISWHYNSFFHQNARFFAPDPGIFSKRFEVRCFVERWGPWFDPNERDLAMHQATRLLHYGRRIRISRGFGKLLVQEYHQTKRSRGCGDACPLDVIKNSKVYGYSKRYATRQCAEKSAATAAVQIRLVHVNPPNFFVIASGKDAISSRQKFEFKPDRISRATTF